VGVWRGAFNIPCLLIMSPIWGLLRFHPNGRFICCCYGRKAIVSQASCPKPCPDSIAALADALYRGAAWLEYTLSKAGNANLQVIRGGVVSKRRLGQGRHQDVDWNPRGERNPPVGRLSEDFAPAPRWIHPRVLSA